jgi:hexosaminidase
MYYLKKHHITMSKKYLLLLAGGLVFSIVAALPLTAEKLPAPFIILPQPQQVTLLGGPGLESGKLEHLVMKGDFNRPVMGSILSHLTSVNKTGAGTLSLVLDTAFNAVPSAEGYSMTISNNSIEIIANGEAGLFYGCQTLEQLLEDAKDYRKPIPACRITDFPVLAYRAVHIDVKHHLDHMNYYYESIDRLARYKINAVVFEFEDKLRYRRQPLVGAPQSISIDEMAALTRYARERHIEITPLVQGLGHATFILKHQQYAHLRELPYNRWAFCPLHEGTYQVLFDLYRDAIEATPGSKYLHIGGDEIGNIGLCPRCKPVADKEGMLSLSLYWLKRVCEFAAENGRIPIFWDDMPLKHAGVYETTYTDDISQTEAARSWEAGIPELDNLLQDFPRNCIYMRWNYSMARQPGNILALDWYKSRGLKAMIATATNTEGGMFFQEDERDKGMASSGIVTIRSFIQLAAEKKIDGMLCTAWDDKSPHLENYWRGFIAAAEYSWSPFARTLEEYDKAWLQREFGLSVPDYLSFSEQLRRGSELWYEAFYRNGNLLDDDNNLQSLARLEHWLPPLAGQENVVMDYKAKLIELPDLKSPGAWSQQYKDRLDRALVETTQYNAISQRLRELHDASTRNRYYWELALALYDLQSMSPRMLLALMQCDSPDQDEHKNGLEQVRKAMADFQGAWTHLQEVYGKTRFVAYPEGYVPDRYFHLASQREDLSWMIQAEEMMHGMIEEWLPQ